MDSSIFVPINKVRRCPDASNFRDYNFSLPPVTEPQNFYEEEEEKPPLQRGERVVWVSDSGPEHGTVKWIGYLHDTRDKEWTVGVEFVSCLQIKSMVFYTVYCMLPNSH